LKRYRKGGEKDVELRDGVFDWIVFLASKGEYGAVVELVGDYLKDDGKSGFTAIPSKRLSDFITYVGDGLQSGMIERGNLTWENQRELLADALIASGFWKKAGLDEMCFYLQLFRMGGEGLRPTPKVFEVIDLLLTRGVYGTSAVDRLPHTMLPADIFRSTVARLMANAIAFNEKGNFLRAGQCLENVKKAMGEQAAKGDGFNLGVIDQTYNQALMDIADGAQTG